MTFLNRLIIIAILTLNSCGGVNFSFKSAEVPQTAKTIAVMQFYNESANGPSNLSQLFTDKLRDYFQSNTKLVLTTDPGNADLVLEGVVKNYIIAPASATSNGDFETAAQQKISMSIKTSYTNYTDTTQNFNRAFDGYAFFESTESLSDVETQKIEDISDQIILKIFNASFDTW